MGGRTQRLEAQEFVVAVRERHHGPASEKALQARLALACEYLDAEMVDDALEVLVSAVIDAGRLFGPNDERTWRTRLDLGLAYEAADRPYDAYGILWTLDADARATPDAGPEILEQIRVAALRVEAAVDQ
jgi:hypothetical protein